MKALDWLFGKEPDDTPKREFRVITNHHARSWIGRHLVRSVEDQAAALDPEKMRKLFASIGVDYRTGSV
jgi:hypothetical protein